MIGIVILTTVSVGLFGVAAFLLFASLAIVWANWVFTGNLPRGREWFGPGASASVAVASFYAGYVAFPLHISVAIGG